MWISGFCRQGDPRFWSLCLGPWPYTVSVANSFRCSFVCVLWQDHQVWSTVATTPLADSKPSYPDSPNAPATARSVYVIVHAAARPPYQTPPSMIWAVTAPNPHAPRATAHRPAPLNAGSRSTRRGLRVGVVDSFGRSFVWGAKLRIA